MDYEDVLASEQHDLHHDWNLHPQTETRQIAHEVAHYSPMMNLMSIDADTIPSLMEEVEMGFLNLREIDIEPNGKSKVPDQFIPEHDFYPVDDLDFSNAIPANQYQDYEWVYYDETQCFAKDGSSRIFCNEAENGDIFEDGEWEYYDAVPINAGPEFDAVLPVEGGVLRKGYKENEKK